MSENIGNIEENRNEVYWANHYELGCDDLPDLRLTCHKVLLINETSTRIEVSFYVTDTTLSLLYGNSFFGVNTEHHVTLKLFKSDGSMVTTLYDGICILKEKKTSLGDIPSDTGNNLLSIVVTFEDK